MTKVYKFRVDKFINMFLIGLEVRFSEHYHAIIFNLGFWTVRLILKTSAPDRLDTIPWKSKKEVHNG